MRSTVTGCGCVATTITIINNDKDWSACVALMCFNNKANGGIDKGRKINEEDILRPIDREMCNC